MIWVERPTLGGGAGSGAGGGGGGGGVAQLVAALITSTDSNRVRANVLMAKLAPSKHQKAPNCGAQAILWRSWLMNSLITKFRCD